MISDTLHRRLTIVNSLVLGALALAFLVLVLTYREKLVNVVHGYFEREFVSSKFIEALLPEDQGSDTESRLPLFEIKIKPTDFREIHVLSQRLVDQGVMLDRDKKWFPARFTHEGREYKVKIRLRGDYSPHWIHAKKSWRIKFKKDNLFKGYREINLVVPSDREDENEEVAYTLARRADLLVPDSGFVQVTTNGIDMGAYFWFENNSPEMLEKAQYPEGEIIRSKNIISEKGYYLYGLSARDFYYVQGSYRNTIRKDVTAGYPLERFGQFLKLVDEADEHTLIERLPYFVDMEKFYRWNAIAWMFGSKHAGGIDNLRWYYDTTTGLFEPILYDVGSRPLGEIDSDNWFVTVFDDYYSPVIRRIMSVPKFRQRRNQVLWQMINDDQFDPAPIARQVFANIKPYLMRGVRSRLGSELKEKHAERIRKYEDNRAYLREYLAFASVYANSRLEIRDGIPALSAQIVPDTRNLISLDAIELAFGTDAKLSTELGEITLTDGSGNTAQVHDVRAEIDGQILRIHFEDLFISGRHKAEEPRLLPTFWHLNVELPGVNVNDWTSLGVMNSLDYFFSNPINEEPISPEFSHHPQPALGFQTPTFDLAFQPVDDFVAKSGLPLHVKGSRVLLGPGSYELHEDLVVPVEYGLELMPGVELNLAPGVSILSYQALRVNGTIDEPVIIQPLVEDQPWGVVAVINAAEESVVQHLHIGGGSETWINGVFVSGQFSFYRSDVRITDSVISNAQADDGLNVKKAHARITNTRFENNSSDAFDGDWVTGFVTESIFSNNGGDGLDTSGANMSVTHTLFSGMGDKGISAGEKSVIRSFNNLVRDSNIGMASKDLSKVDAYANVFYNNKVAVALYRKKQIFGGGRARVVSSLFWDNNNNISMDEESSFEALGIGADKWVASQGAEIADLRQGVVADSYKLDGEGSVVFSPASVKDSPFAAGPKTEKVSIEDLALPDFSQSPIGLVTPIGGVR